MLNLFENLRVAVLCSKRAPGLEVLLHHPQRGQLYEIGCVVTTEIDFPERAWIEGAGTPVLVHPLRVFHAERQADLRDREVRREYDAVTAAALGHLGVNAVVLLSYPFILTEPMLSAFPRHILNVHDGDLTLKRADGRRKYTGLHATRDAIVMKEKETRSSVHVVSEEIDGGEVLLLSDAFPVAPFVHEAVAAGAIDVVKAYSYAHREWMIRSCWGPLVVRSLEYLASGIEVGQAVAGS
jgi:phosphoribosylglycinamide formyltransferase 1